MAGPNQHEDKCLTDAVDKIVEGALSRAILDLNKACVGMGDNPSLKVSNPPDVEDSTQVLVPITPFPEESMARIPASRSFIEKHTITIQSKLDASYEVHRNMAGSRLNLLNEGDISMIDHGRTFTPDRSARMGGSPCVYGQQETIIQEMSYAVATRTFDGIPLPYIQDIYNKFAGVAQAVININEGGHIENMNATLGPDLQQRVLRTLSEVKFQLDQVKNQLVENRRTSR